MFKRKKKTGTAENLLILKYRYFLSESRSRDPGIENLNSLETWESKNTLVRLSKFVFSICRRLKFNKMYLAVGQCWKNYQCPFLIRYFFLTRFTKLDIQFNVITCNVWWKAHSTFYHFLRVQLKKSNWIYWHENVRRSERQLVMLNFTLFTVHSDYWNNINIKVVWLMENVKKFANWLICNKWLENVGNRPYLYPSSIYMIIHIALVLLLCIEYSK